MKHVQPRPYADPEKSARRILEHARAFEPIQGGRIYIEKINAPFLFGDNRAGRDYAIERGWLELHESGTYVRISFRMGKICAPSRRRAAWTGRRALILLLLVLTLVARRLCRTVGRPLR